jgi:CHASE2 domain-containing sensor protein
MAFSTGWDGRRILLIGVLLSISWVVLSPVIIYLAPQPFRWLNNKNYDFKLSLFAKSRFNPDIVHLDIDDDSIIEKVSGLGIEH